ncbi:MAG: hypothetical protein AAF479_11785 [Pseudomonadota bacterium]
MWRPDGKLRSELMLGLMLAGGTLISGCDQRGFSGVQAEWERRKSQQFYVVAASSEAAVVSALGKEVAIRPADGFCLSRESIETSNRSAVALIGDCVLETDVSSVKRSARGELALPRALPGIITISISGDPFEDPGGLDASAIETFLQSPQGRSLIGRTADGSQVKIRESRRQDDAIYLLVEDKNTGPIPILSETFWRAFMTVQDRLAVVTISGFRARPLGVERMLGHLSEQVVAMQDANRGGLEDTRRLIARSKPLEVERIASTETGGIASDATEATRLGDLEPTSIILSTTGTGKQAEKPAAPEETAQSNAAKKPPEPEIEIKSSTTLPVGKSVVPKSRPGSTLVPKTRTATLQNPSSGSGNTGAEPTAPASAPIAPKRRKRS